MSLTSGKASNCCSWTEMPIANDVIKRVEELAGDDAPEDLVFGDGHGNPLDKVEDAEMAGVVPVITGVDDDDASNNCNDGNATV